jgi:CsoR family transcriptional regulator, copper-sensing transcriptional repressor
MQMATSDKQELIKRLNRIKGQVEGIIRMIEHPKPAVEIFHQVTAAKKALDSTGRHILEKYIKDNLGNFTKSKEEENKLKDILDIMEKI